MAKPREALTDAYRFSSFDKPAWHVAASVEYSNDGRRNNHEESDNNHEEDEERLEGRKRRRLSLSADRCENQGAE